jgi:hypothetical protein
MVEAGLAAGSVRATATVVAEVEPDFVEVLIQE